MFRQIFCLVAVLLLSLKGLAVAETRPKSVLPAPVQHVFRLSPDNDLSQGNVFKLALDQHNKLWLANEDGLDSYDGYRVNPVRFGLLSETTSIEDFMFVRPGIMQVASASHGLLQLDLYDNSITTLQQIDESLSDKYSQMIYVIRQDKSGNMIYANLNTVFQLRNEQLVSVFTLPSDDIYTHFIWDILQVGNHIYIASSEQLWRLDLASGQYQQIHFLTGNSSAKQRENISLYIDQHFLYVGTRAGLHRIPVEQLDQPFKDPPLKVVSEKMIDDATFWLIRPAPQGGLMLASSKGLVHLADDSTINTLFQPSQTPQPHYDDTVYDFAQDEYGNFWLAIRGDGAYYWQPRQQRFTNIGIQQQLSHPIILSLLSDNDVLWAGSQNGLNRIELSTKQVSRYLVNLDPDVVGYNAAINHILPGNENRIWLMTDENIRLFNGQTLLEEYVKSPEVAVQLAKLPYSMAADKLGNLFLQNDNGFFRISADGAELTPLSVLNDAAKNVNYSSIYSIDPQHSNALIISFDAAIWRYNFETTQLQLLYKLPEGMQRESSYLESMVVLGDSLWLLFYQQALVELDRETLEIKQQKFSDELPAYSLYAMQADRLGYLWLSSHRGLWRYNIEADNFRQFTVLDGLVANEFNGMVHATLPNGKLAFGSIKGVTLFDPIQFTHRQNKVRELAVSHLSLMSRKLPDLLQPLKKAHVELDHQDYGLQIYLSTFSYKQQNQTRYRFELTGPSAIPAFTSYQPTLLLPQLKAGRHLLTVTAFDPLKEKYTTPAYVEIVVKAAPWLNSLAKSFYFLLLLSAISYWFYRRQQQRQLLLNHNQQLQQSEQRLMLALDTADSNIWQWQAENDCIFHQARLALLGVKQPDNGIVFREYVELIHPDDRNDFQRSWLELLQQETEQFDLIYRIKDRQGNWLWFKDVGKVTQPGISCAKQITGIYTNITARKLTEQALTQLTHHDSLTGLPNRKLLLTLLTDALQAQAIVAVCFIDLNRFKQINDSLGHEKGDQVLQVIASRLKNVQRPTDILAHLGSDEFVLVLSLQQAEQLAGLLQQVLQQLEQPLTLDNELLSISCSIGVSRYPADSSTAAELLKQADIAMYHAKTQSHQPYLLYQATMQQLALHNLTLEHQFKQALAAQQLQNYYQPVVNINTTKVTSIELLLRWNNNGKMVPPDQFILLAEQLGLIDQLTWQSLRQALTDLQQLHSNGYQLELSVNLSAVQLCSANLASNLQALLVEHPALLPWIKLEITESAIMTNRKLAIATMHQLKAAGFSLYLDDFGTGYSSLTYLQEFPIDLIKIDRRFIRDLIPTKPHAILDTILTLADNLSLQCIAEGVETPEQLSYLQQRDCQLIQGYLFAKPIPVEQLREYLKDAGQTIAAILQSLR
ncbi:EAL domain-containing protein [Arsukibacterium perlucidum]|uniref:EAL domain-containing protein n=1 Tax=Arsukibacterium perlucidum TaxID=368811 RepID=UPI0003658B2F|nr:EAL domain-containing protein [Arsukibacterium perlucidum]